MKWGLKDSDLGTLEALVLKPLKSAGYKVYLFGSRARGSHHEFSDVDLLLIPPGSVSNSPTRLSEIQEAIEESRFPVKVDFVIDQHLAKSYRENVDMEKVEI
jgi:predicted nucleotidyltransferase